MINSPFQGQTMQMMYEIIARELKALHLDSHPQEYLNFYCLGNREKLQSELPGSSNSSPNNSDTVIMQQIDVFSGTSFIC